MDTLRQINEDLESAVRQIRLRLYEWEKTFELPDEPGKKEVYGVLAVTVYQQLKEGNLDAALAEIVKFQRPQKKIKEAEEELENLRASWLERDKKTNKRLEKKYGLQVGELQENTTWNEAKMRAKIFGKYLSKPASSQKEHDENAMEFARILIEKWNARDRAKALKQHSALKPRNRPNL